MQQHSSSAQHPPGQDTGSTATTTVINGTADTPATIHRIVFTVSALLTLALIGFTLAFPGISEQVLGHALAWVSDRFGWYYMLIVAAYGIFSLYVGMSKYGDIKLGQDHEKPDFPYLAWAAMLFSAGIGIDLLSDQTSCHAAYDGGYCPQGVSFEERTRLLAEDREQFVKLVDETLTKHFHLIQKLVERGSYFFDYGNSFMKAIFDAGNPEIAKNKRDTTEGFIFPSYVEDIMGPMLFDYGYGPFRWCCLSGKHEDLLKTDHAAMEIIDPNRRFQDRDNWVWIRDADKNKLVVGTQCRILYQDALGRRDIALRFNEMVRNGEIGPVMLGRDHHDTGGTDSPYRETSNIYDGSQFTADMATHCFAGNAARGMSLIALHNGGGVGIGKAINGGFGLVLDGSELTDQIIRESIPWDTMVGVSRRNWARNEHSIETVAAYNEKFKDSDHITMPYIASDSLVEQAFRRATEKH